MNTEFYKQMLDIKRKNIWSCREMAKECDLCYGTIIEFFNKAKPFRQLQDVTMAKLHKHFGISYEVMEDFNKYVQEERGW